MFLQAQDKCSRPAEICANSWGQLRNNAGISKRDDEFEFNSNTFQTQRTEQFGNDCTLSGVRQVRVQIKLDSVSCSRTVPGYGANVVQGRRVQVQFEL